MTDYQKLRRLAENATPGPWTISYERDDFEMQDNPPYPHALIGPKNRTEWDDPEWQEEWGHQVNEICELSETDAEFIAAANPQTVIGLLDVLYAHVQLIKAQADEIARLRAGQGTYEGVKA